MRQSCRSRRTGYSGNELSTHAARPHSGHFDHRDWPLELKHDGFRALRMSRATCAASTPLTCSRWTVRIFAIGSSSNGSADCARSCRASPHAFSTSITSPIAASTEARRAALVIPEGRQHLVGRVARSREWCRRRGADPAIRRPGDRAHVPTARDGAGLGQPRTSARRGGHPRRHALAACIWKAYLERSECSPVHVPLAWEPNWYRGVQRFQ